MTDVTGATKIPWTYVIGVAATLLIAIAMLTVQWQTAIDKSNGLEKELNNLTVEHRDDIARLDESNRNRRNQIADLEERIAVVEERTKGQ